MRDDICRYVIHGLVTDDGVQAPPTQVVFASDYDALETDIARLEGLMDILRAQHQLVRDDANAATLRCAELALENERLRAIEGEWLALSQDDGKVERALVRSEEECARLRSLLAELIDIEGPQPGHVTWYRKVCAALGQDQPTGEQA